MISARTSWFRASPGTFTSTKPATWKRARDPLSACAWFMTATRLVYSVRAALAEPRSCERFLVYTARMVMVASPLAASARWPIVAGAAVAVAPCRRAVGRVTGGST